jgi:hypothetical protein
MYALALRFPHNSLEIISSSCPYSLWVRVKECLQSTLTSMNVFDCFELKFGGSFISYWGHRYHAGLDEYWGKHDVNIRYSMTSTHGLASIGHAPMLTRRAPRSLACFFPAAYSLFTRRLLVHPRTVLLLTSNTCRKLASNNVVSVARPTDGGCILLIFFASLMAT